MANVLMLTSPIPPSVNHYLGWRSVYNPKTKKYMAMSYETAEAKKYKKDFSDYVIKQVKQQGWDLELNKNQHFYADCVFYFERTDQDPNNYYKLPWDSITETQTIWADDNVTCERCLGIRYDSKNPRIEIKIYPTDYIGIFDNRVQLEEFESNCFECARHKRNCSILNKAKVGRIQAEIENCICSEFKQIKIK